MGVQLTSVANSRGLKAVYINFCRFHSHDICTWYLLLRLYNLIGVTELHSDVKLRGIPLNLVYKVS